MEHKNRTAKTLLGFILLLIIPVLACETNRPADPNDFTAHDLSHKDFRFQIISGYDLSNRNFQGTIFAYIEVYDTDFSHADLRGADFSGAFFEDVDFSNADLRDVDLSYASTRFNSKVNFQGADLRGAKLDFACLDADWTDAQLDEKWHKVFQLLDAGIQPGQDLRNYDLSYACIGQQNLVQVDLSGANLQGTVLDGANLEDAILIGTNLQEARIGDANLRNAVLLDANFLGTHLSGTNLMGATVIPEQLEQALFLCTRMPDGTIRNSESYCTPPEP